MDKKGDVGFIEDLIQALVNLVSLEEHSINSYYMNQDAKWLEVNDIARNMRSELLQLIVKKENSQLWCASKHLLASIMATRECGNRFYSQGKKSLAEDLYSKSSILFGLLLSLNEILEENVEPQKKS